jgi:hypothetical protein
MLEVNGSFPNEGEFAMLEVNGSFPNEGEFAMNANAGKIRQPMQIV